MAKRFFYVCAGIFLLALTYHLGARTATAQAGGTIVGIAGFFAQNTAQQEVDVVTSSGDVYRRQGDAPWQYRGNVFGAGPTAVTPQSWGQVKDRYRR